MSIKLLNTENKAQGYIVNITVKGHYNKSLKAQKQRKLIGASLLEAQKVERQLREEAKREIKFKESNGPTLGELLEKWKFLHLMRVKTDTPTQSDYYQTLKMYGQSLMKHPVNHINNGHIEGLYEEMKRLEKSNSRMRALRSSINALYDWSHKEGLVPRHIISPAKGAKIPIDRIKKEQPILNRDEIEVFLSKAKEANHDFFHTWAVALHTGMRAGELYALEWKDVDLETMLITVNKSYNHRMGGIKSTKNRKSRQIPINEELKNILNELKISTFKSGYVLQRLSLLRRGEASKTTRDFCRMIGIREINFHATRACWAIQCLNSGVMVPVVMSMGGWHGFKAFQHYLRLSGVEVNGATSNLSFIKEKTNAKVLKLTKD